VLLRCARSNATERGRGVANVDVSGAACQAGVTTELAFVDMSRCGVAGLGS
jgi:hypothetical protein